MKKYFFIIAAGLLVGVFFVSEETHFVEDNVTAPSVVPVPTTPPPSQEETVEPLSEALPQPPETIDRSDTLYRSDTIDKEVSVLLDVPFQSQAPFGRWSQPWQDACEEASLVLANRFAHGTRTLSREEMRDEIMRLVDFQNDAFGDYKDSDAERTAAIGREVYGLEVEVKEVEGVYEVIEALRQGRLVIAPMAGRELRNPYFTPPGPLYHMLVVRGFDEATGEFITNDVGTRRGEALRYKYGTLWNALHDFPGEKERIAEGHKIIIVVDRKT